MKSYIGVFSFLFVFSSISHGDCPKLAGTWEDGITIKQSSANCYNISLDGVDFCADGKTEYVSKMGSDETRFVAKCEDGKLIMEPSVNGTLNFKTIWARAAEGVWLVTFQNSKKTFDKLYKKVNSN